jgi:glycosyltransferase involved in cell wall biosynthesis
VRRHHRRATDQEQLYSRIVNGDHADGDRGRIVLCTSTHDLASGRGDLFVAAALGRELTSRGYGVTILAQQRWKDVPRDAAVVVALLPTFDAAAVPDNIPLVAWVRNETERWLESPTLGLYDGLLASSTLSLDLLRESFSGPARLLPLAADPAVFTDPGRRRRQVVSSVNSWGRRRDVYDALAELAPTLTHVDLYGATKGMPTELRRFSRGQVSYFELPDIYARALVVLDDMNHTTLPFGNRNSRLFEALAAGALPITNGRLGLTELGLDDVPVYHDSTGLAAILDEARRHPDDMARRAAQMRDVVLSQHTFAHRAEQFLSFLTEDVVGVGEQRRPTLTFAPDYSKWNPYQDMLYTAARRDGVRVAAGDVVTLERLAARDSGESASHHVFHLHWTAPLLQSAPDPFAAIRKLRSFQQMVTDFQARGGRVAWTIHNVLPHEVTYRSTEIELCRFLARTADIVHVLSEQTRDACAPLYELPPERTHVVEHSSYVGVYPDIVERDEARRRLRVQPSDVALLLFGGVRPYKGVAGVLELFDRARARERRLRLLVAGLPGRFPGVQELTERFEKHPQVTSRFEFVPDDELQVWQRAADVALLPYPSVLNSGAFQLALTFGLPVIAPNVGSIAAMLDPAYTIGYRADNDDALVEAMVDAPRLAAEARGLSHAAAVRRPPVTMAMEFYDLLRQGSPALAG